MNIIDLHKISSQHILFDIRSILGKNTMVYTEIASNSFIDIIKNHNYKTILNTNLNMKTDILYIDNINDYNIIYNDNINMGGYIVLQSNMFDSNIFDSDIFDIYIINNNINNYIVAKKKSNIRFAIVMATFCRSNGKTPTYLKRSIESVVSQTYKNWDLIIVADKYEPREELDGIINNYITSNITSNNKIIYIYNDIVERDYITDKVKLWCCAGASSMNKGLEYARANNYKYYCHLDDDDFWTNNHLEKLAYAYSNYSNCVFANTQSTFCNSYLPKNEENITTVYPNNRLPLAQKVIHSSFSFRLDIILFEYFTTHNMNDNFWYSDAIMLNNIKGFLEENKQYCSIYMPYMTCYHDYEGETITS
jgi:hypothetical protein